jgi:hypothetical protein
MQELSLGARRVRAAAALLAVICLSVQIFRVDESNASSASVSDVESKENLGSFFVSNSVERPKFSVDREYLHQRFMGMKSF